MSLKQSFFHNSAQLLFERPGRKYTLAEWQARLARSLEPILARAAAPKNEEAAVRALRHVIGIERWGQSRMRQLLGAPALQDEYDGYMPAALSAAALRDELAATRAETIDLAGQIAAAGVPLDATAPHNDFGPLTARAWLAYLNSHTTRETMRIR